METLMYEASAPPTKPPATGLLQSKIPSSDQPTKLPPSKDSENVNGNGDVQNFHTKMNNCSDIDTSFSSQNGRQAMDIIFENVTYTVTKGIFKRVKKEILHGVHGRFLSTKLTAIMGPSGAGKSTLLDILSGYRITGVEGQIFVNGKPRDLNVFRRSSAYITQDDRLQPLLSVMENMKISADLKLPSRVSTEEKNKIIKNILKTLGLIEHVDTRAARLSGGQQKRLSIALELVNDPTVLFLDEPTTGLDSSSCTQVVNLLKVLARQGKTIVCTIHQPSASLFQVFDQVYVLASGECLYQGTVPLLIPYLESVNLPCPKYHNPADYVIELACGEHGEDKIKNLVEATENGKSLTWFQNAMILYDRKGILDTNENCSQHIDKESEPDNVEESKHQATSQFNQLKVLLGREFKKANRNTTTTHIRIAVNIIVGIMYGGLYYDGGNDANRIFSFYNLLFTCLMHHMMTPMMITVLTFPMEMSILQKEHFNRWYSLKMYYLALNIVDIPISILGCTLFSVIVYWMTSQPPELYRFLMFFTISLLIAFVGQSFGLLIGACFNVTNGTFMAPTSAVPIMMFAGFGVSLKDIPSYLKWGTHISYLRYGLEGYIAAIYNDRKKLDCLKKSDENGPGICFYRYVKKFLEEHAAGFKSDQFVYDVIAIVVILMIVKVTALLLFRLKLKAAR